MTLQESVRKRPGMYFGDLENEAINNITYELVANVVDLFLAGQATKVAVNVSGLKVVVSDDGPGLPFQEPPSAEHENYVEYYLTQRHDTPTADAHAPHIHIFHGGLGLAVLNAASKRILIRSSDGQKIYQQEFGMGNAPGPAKYETTTEASGTRIELDLDPEIFADSALNSFELRRVMFELAHLYPGLTVELANEKFYSNNGLLDLAYLLYRYPRTYNASLRKFHYHGKKDDVEIDVAALGETENNTEFTSWVNGKRTILGGAHVNALNTAFQRADWRPEIALISIVMHDPDYAGPTKDRLITQNIQSIIEEILFDRLVNA